MDYSKYLLITDLDGTLLHGSEVPPRNVEAIRRFIERGGKFTIASGRAIGPAIMHIRDIPLSAPAVIINGGIIYDYEKGEMLQKQALPVHVKDYLIGIMAAFPDVGVEIFTSDNDYVVRNNFVIENHLSREKLVANHCDLKDVPEGDWIKVLMCSPSPERQAEVQAYVANHPYEGYYFVPTSARYYEIMKEGVSKASGLEYLFRYCGLERSHVVAIGDYYNDSEILEAAGFSVCPENAPEDIKESVDLVVCHCKDGAVGELIEYMEKNFA